MAAKSVDVALIINGQMFGGGQRVVLDLVHEAEKAGVGLVLVLLGQSVPNFDSKTPSVVGYDGRYDRPATLVKAAIELRRRIQSMGVSLIHTHGWDADIIGSLARVGLGVKQLVHLHIEPAWLGSQTFRHKARRWMTRIALAGSDVRILAVSEAVRRHWTSNLGLDPNTIQVMRTGIDANRYQPSCGIGGTSVPIIGVAGRLVSMKGIEYLIDSLSVLAHEGAVYELRIAGTGSLRETLESRCVHRGIHDRAKFLGQVSDMPAFYRTIDIYALPSLSEGLPLGVLEAMASGVAVLATSVGGIPEAVRNGIDGVLVPPGDVNALADGLRRLLGDAGKRRTMGNAGRARAVEIFSLERFSDEVFALYREMLAERRA